MSECKYCGADRKLVKAHIIPEAFFRPLRQGGDTPLVVSNIKGDFPKRAPIGIYDSEILCASCEDSFGKYDGYGAETIFSKFDEFFSSINPNGEVVGFQSSSVNKELLLRFLIATLWRASVSAQKFYDRVNLGPYQALARSVLVTPAEPVPMVFDAVLSRWTDDDVGIMCPFRERWSGVNAYRFYLSPVVAYIKVDRRELPVSLSELGLQAEGGVTAVVVRDFRESKDHKAFVRVAKACKMPTRRTNA